MISIPVDIFEIMKPIFTGTDFSSDDFSSENKPRIECNFLDPLSQKLVF